MMSQVKNEVETNEQTRSHHRQKPKNEARVRLTEQTKVCGMSISSSILQWLKQSNRRLSMKITYKGNLNVMI